MIRVITISREYGSGGGTVARMLAERLGWRLVDQSSAKKGDQLQLKFLHISRTYRNRGWGQQLFDWAKSEAHQRGAKSLYISATPSEHTIGFYLRLGCRVTQEPDAELFELEPEDIHLECALA